MSMYGEPNVTGELRCKDESLTKQSFEQESNINVIFARAIRNGWDPRLLPQVEQQFADVSQVGDYRDAQDRILRGQEIFSQLSAQDRLRFANDPAVFFEFAVDPANEEEVARMRFGKEGVDAIRAQRAGSEGVRGSVSGSGQDGGPGDPNLEGARAVAAAAKPGKGDGAGGDRPGAPEAGKGGSS